MLSCHIGEREGIRNLDYRQMQLCSRDQYAKHELCGEDGFRSGSA